MDDSRAGSTTPHHHHFTAADWQRIEGETEFRHLVGVKRRFIIPATVVFVLYYFSLPVLVGYYPQMMSHKIFGSISVAYIFALSQFIMAWAIMALYLHRAKYFDRLEHEIAAKVRGEFQ